jgi:hypothetical protein
VQEEVLPVVSLVKFCVPQPESTATAESGSLTVHATVTLDTYQSLLPSVPVIDLVITGGVESAAATTRNVVLSGLVVPTPPDGDAVTRVSPVAAPLVAVTLNDCDEPHEVNDRELGLTVTPEGTPASDTEMGEVALALQFPPAPVGPPSFPVPWMDTGRETADPALVSKIPCVPAPRFTSLITRMSATATDDSMKTITAQVTAVSAKRRRRSRPP